MNEEMRRAGEELERLLEELGLASPDAITVIMSEWATLAPEAWASLARPLRLADGELTVEVEDGGAASVLRYRVAELTSAINQKLGDGTVANVRIRRA